MQRKRLAALLVKSNISNLLSIEMPADYDPLLELSKVQQPVKSVKFEEDLVMKYKDMLRV